MAENPMMDILKQKLQERQHKMTVQRQTVLQIFLDHPGEHLSAEDVYGILRDGKKDFGLATVYRSLELLSGLGILQKMDFGDGCSRYEINTADPKVHHHHHLICKECNKVIEVEEDLLDDLEQAIFEENGFKVTDHQVKFIGICRECREKES